MAGLQKQNIHWAFSLFLVMLYFSSLTAQAKYGGGMGEPNDPYQIATVEDLILLGEEPNDYDKHFILTADIDLDPNLPGRKVFEKAVIPPQPDPNFGRTAKTIPFTGVFDGSGHTISHLTIKGVDTLGLFGRLGSGAMVSNLGLEGVDVNGEFGVGALVGSSYGTVIDCHSTGSVTGSLHVGGLAGDNFGSITSSYSTSTVTGYFNFVGGLVGWNYGSVASSYSTSTVNGAGRVGGLVGDNNGSITTSYSTGTVTGTGDGSSVGGLVGWNSLDGSIASSYSTGTVNGAGGPVGGLVGRNYGSVSSSYSNSTVTGTVDGTDVGGLVGLNYGSVASSYSNGTVNGAGGPVGGLVGENGEGGSITSSFWDMESSGLLTSDGGIAKTTAEMQMANTFTEAGWDFVDETANGTEDVWWILEGQDYPRLWWELAEANFIVVDDFESYNDLDPGPMSNRIFNTWIDGYGDPNNGSFVDCAFPCPEIFHSGKQSMPFSYDNSGPALYSEATANIAKLAVNHDWTIEGVGVLSLWFYGGPANAPEPMYVGIANANGPTAEVFHDNPDAPLINEWTQWNIDLQEFANQGVDLTNVNLISIGFGNKNNPQPGGSGKVWFDDIRLYRLAP